MTWRQKPLDNWLRGVRGGLTFSFRCLICDLAFELKMSEEEFYERFDMTERAQLLATYRSQLDRQTAMAIAPQPPQKR